jgi:hypothetical protein
VVLSLYSPSPVRSPKNSGTAIARSQKQSSKKDSAKVSVKAKNVPGIDDDDIRFSSDDEEYVKEGDVISDLDLSDEDTTSPLPDAHKARETEVGEKVSVQDSKDADLDLSLDADVDVDAPAKGDAGVLPQLDGNVTAPVASAPGRLVDNNVHPRAGAEVVSADISSRSSSSGSSSSSSSNDSSSSSSDSSSSSSSNDSSSSSSSSGASGSNGTPGGEVEAFALGGSGSGSDSGFGSGFGSGALAMRLGMLMTKRAESANTNGKSCP